MEQIMSLKITTVQFPNKNFAFKYEGGYEKYFTKARLDALSKNVILRRDAKSTMGNTRTKGAIQKSFHSPR